MLPSPFCYELTSLRPTDPEPARSGARAAGAGADGTGRAAACGGLRPARRTSKTACVPARQRNWRVWRGGAYRAPTPDSGTASTPLSTDEPLWCGDDHTVTLSPSTLQMLTDCPLRWLLERHGGSDGRDVRSAIGSLLHALVADPGKTENQMLNELEKVWEKAAVRFRVVFGQRAGPAPGDVVDVRAVAGTDPRRAHRGGHRDRRRRRGRRRATMARGCGCAGAWTGWNATARDGWWSSTSRPVRARSPRTTPSATPSWRCTSWPSRKVCCRRAMSPAAAGWCTSARPAAAAPTEREQDALTADRTRQWREQVQQAAAATQGPEFVARINDGCAHCPVRAMCPAQARAGGRS